VGTMKTAQALCAEWLRRVFGADAAANSAPDPIENPFLCAARSDLRRIVEILLSDAPVDASTVIPEDLVRLRAVQDISAAEAVSHMFVLKDIVRERLSADPGYEQLMQRLDFLALHTFNAYARCREALYQLRLQQIMQYGAAETFACSGGKDTLVQLRTGAGERAK